MARWSKDEIAMEILNLYASGEEINYGSMQEKHPSLLRTACRYFGSWREAVEFAGLPYGDVRRYQTWTPERIIARIRELHDQAVDLSWRNVSTRVDPQLAAAAARSNQFGSWRAAVEAAGLDYAGIRRYRDWDDARILEEIRALASAGHGVSSKDVQSTDVGLFTAAIRHFSSWDEALRAAGVDASQVRLRARSPQRAHRAPKLPTAPK